MQHDMVLPRLGAHEKLVIFIRHAQSTFNVAGWNRAPELLAMRETDKERIDPVLEQYRDAPLTAFGVSEAFGGTSRVPTDSERSKLSPCFPGRSTV